ALELVRTRRHEESRYPFLHGIPMPGRAVGRAIGTNRQWIAGDRVRPGTALVASRSVVTNGHAKWLAHLLEDGVLQHQHVDVRLHEGVVRLLRREDDRFP